MDSRRTAPAADLDAGATPDAVVGIISDTHGVLDPRVAQVFSGVDRILHAGDIGSVAVMLELETIAPVSAVLGNTDREIPGYALPLTAKIEIASVVFAMAHKPKQLEKSGLLLGADIAINGHTHAPSIDLRDGILHVNPGTASSGRVSGERSTVAVVEVRRGLVSARIIELA